MFVPILTSGNEGCAGHSCGRGIPREAGPRFIGASVLIAVTILTVAMMQTGAAFLPAGAGTLVAIAGVIFAGLLVNRVARQPGLPLLCAMMTATTLLAGTVLGISGLTAPWMLGGLLFVPILVGTASPRWTAGILATGIIVVVSVIAAMTAGPPIQ